MFNINRSAMSHLYKMAMTKLGSFLHSVHATGFNNVVVYMPTHQYIR